MNNENDLYTLDQLIKILEKMRDEGEGDINFAKALYTLSLEIRDINRWIDLKSSEDCYN